MLSNIIFVRKPLICKYILYQNPSFDPYAFIICFRLHSLGGDLIILAICIHFQLGYIYLYV